MKNIIRAFVVVLALTGAAASTQIASASAQSKVTVSKDQAMPIPMCPPDDPMPVESTVTSNFLQVFEIRGCIVSCHALGLRRRTRNTVMDAHSFVHLLSYLNRFSALLF